MLIALSLALFFLALAPWLLIAIIFYNAQFIFAQLLAWINVNRIIGGEPLSIVNKRFALEERKLLAAIKLDDLEAEQKRRMLGMQTQLEDQFNSEHHEHIDDNAMDPSLDALPVAPRQYTDDRK